MEAIIFKPISMLNRRYQILLAALLSLYRQTETFIEAAIQLQAENDFESFISLHYDLPQFTYNSVVDRVLAALPLVNNIVHDQYLLKEQYEKWLNVGAHVRVRRKVIVKLKRLYRTVEGINCILHRLRYTLNISHELSSADESLAPLMRQYRRSINCLTTFALAQARHKYEAFFTENYITIEEGERFVIRGFVCLVGPSVHWSVGSLVHRSVGNDRVEKWKK